MTDSLLLWESQGGALMRCMKQQVNNYYELQQGLGTSTANTGMRRPGNVVRIKSGKLAIE